MPNVCLEQEHKGTNVKKDLYLWWWLCYTISIESKKPQNGTVKWNTTISEADKVPLTKSSNWNFVRFDEIIFQTDVESFSFLAWKTKKVLFIKEYGLGRSSSKSAKRVLTDGICCPNFQLRFCSKLSNYVQLPNCLIKKILARLYYKDYCGITAAILKNAEKSTFIVRKSTQ